MKMMRPFLCYMVVVLSFLNGTTAGIKTSDGSWTYQSQLSTATAGSNLEPSLGSASISTNNVTTLNSTSICSTASIHGKSTVQELCRHTPAARWPSWYTISTTQSTTNTSLSDQAAAAPRITNVLGEVSFMTAVESSAATSGISAAAQTFSSAAATVLNTTVEQVPPTQSRLALLQVAPSKSSNQGTWSNKTASTSQSSSTTTISNGSDSPAATSYKSILDPVSGMIMSHETTSPVIIPTSATSASLVTTVGNANATESNASLVIETNELQHQLLAAIALTQTWVNNSTENKSSDAVNAINGTIFFAQVRKGPK